MKIWHTDLPLPEDDPYIKKFFTPSSIFFDIETTGFSRTSAQVYMIGYGIRKGRTIHITQLFAEDPQAEKDLISSFLELLSHYDTLISYHGAGFDLPFLKSRCSHYKLPEQLHQFHHLDLYRKIFPFKSTLKLPDLKQKTLEHFLTLPRQDLYSGGELIAVYQDYLASASEDACQQLKLHNLEDITGMIHLLPCLAYPELLEGNFTIVSCKTNPYKTYEGTSESEWILEIKPDLPLPKPFSFQKNDIYLTGRGQQAKLRAKLYQGELKYFYPNYKDYYYLPAEDMAVHKSVASYVDKKYRRQASAADCYSKKSSCFLPQFQEIFSPALKWDYHDKKSYFELTEDFKESADSLKQYALHLLSELMR
ncbi:MAG: ribonuclease H-like domain-containing protein [Lachnospiraceae bacterium]|nr:ribonuclease H-like domain-containing protein [Lachnospiraceae bacterium]